MKVKNHLKYLITDESTGEIICNCGCGYIVEERTISNDLSSNLKDENGSKVLHGRGVPTRMMHNCNLSTIIGKLNIDHANSRISSDNQQLFYKLRNHNQKTMFAGMDTGKRKMYYGLQELSRISSLLNLNHSLTDNSAVIYRKAVMQGISSNRNIKHFVSACCYFACKQFNMPISTNDFIHKIKLNKKLFFDYCYLLSAKSGIVGISNNPLVSYLSQIANDMKLNNVIVSKAMDFVNVVKESSIVDGKNPKSVAAALLYLSSTIHHGSSFARLFTQDDFSESAGITSVTIRNLSKIIKIYCKEKGFM